MSFSCREATETETVLEWRTQEDAVITVTYEDRYHLRYIFNSTRYPSWECGPIDSEAEDFGSQLTSETQTKLQQDQC